MKDLRGRLEKLEQAARPQGGVVVMTQIGRETTDETTRRWERAHPGESTRPSWWSSSEVSKVYAQMATRSKHSLGRWRNA